MCQRVRYVLQVYYQDHPTPPTPADKLCQLRFLPISPDNKIKKEKKNALVHITLDKVIKHFS
jgi:hypothetical protein